MRFGKDIEFRTAWDSLRGSKMRNFWTMFGVIVGVASVITIVSIGEGVKQQVSGQIRHAGKNLITIRPAQLKTGGGNNGNGSALSGVSISGTFSNTDVSTVMQTKNIGSVAPLSIVSGKVSGDNGPYKDGFVIGTTSDLSSLLNQSVESGSFLTDYDIGSNAAVLGKHAADRLFNEDVPLGRSFSFHGQDFFVRGIFNDFNSSPIGREVNFDNAIFIPQDVAMDLTNQAAPIYEILAKPTDTSRTQATAAELQRNLDKSHGGQSNLTVTVGSQNLVASDYILTQLTKLIAGVAAISLIVGGIGIMNVMLVSVAERMHEIGIRKAVGATNRQILGQFMIESTTLSLIGGAIGIGLALLIDLFIQLATDIKPIVSWQVIVLAAGVSLAVGVVFGSVPAVKAARRHPIDALRAE